MIALALAAAIVFRTPDPAHTLVIDTTRGRAVVELRPEFAPASVARVEALARRATYDGLQFHRVIAGRFAQTGNPNNKDGGGTELPDLKLEVVKRLEVARLPAATRGTDQWSGFLGAQPWASLPPGADGKATAWGVYCAGVMGMGRQAAPDTGNSEVFFTFHPERGFDHDYAVVGRVVVGLDALRAVSVGEPPSRSPIGCCACGCSPTCLQTSGRWWRWRTRRRPPSPRASTLCGAPEALTFRCATAPSRGDCDERLDAGRDRRLGTLSDRGSRRGALGGGVTSPWGAPSDAVLHGVLQGVQVRFLPRHGRGHRLSPSHLNYRANIDALKRCGVTDVLSISAVGSLREHLPPGAFVAVDQFVDRTFARESSFFGEGCVAHVSMAEPVCHRLTALAAAAAKDAGAPVTVGGTYLAMEGPQFSTKAESRLYRQWGCDVIGMTNLPEAKLAREAELPYASLAMVTDYDAWREEEGSHVEVAHILEVMHANAALAKATLQRLCALLAARPREASPIDTGLDIALITSPDNRDPSLMARLDAVAGRVLGDGRAGA